MKIIMCVFIFTGLISIKVYSQVYWDLPYEGNPLKDSTLIVLPPFDWGYNGKFQPSGYAKIRELGNFMYKHQSYEYVIKLHTKSWGNENSNMLLSKYQQKEVEATLRNDSLLKNIKYTIVPLGSSNPLISNDCIKQPEDSQYWFFLHKINERVEVYMYKRK